MEYLNFQEANCQNCYKCLRTCKNKAIQLLNKQAKIIPDLCVGCGECFAICPQNAKIVKTDIELVKLAILQKKKLVVSLAPSFPSYDDLSDPLQFIAGLKKLDLILEVSATDTVDEKIKTYNAIKRYFFIKTLLYILKN